MKIAVIGSGVSGLGAGWALARHHDVQVFEAERRAGGHARTITVSATERDVPVDTGFIVYNEQNYPQLTRLLDFLEVRTEPSNMSFSVSVERGTLEYEGSLLGLVAQPRNALRPTYRRMVREILRFYRDAPGVLDDRSMHGVTLGTYLDQQGYGTGFAENHILPMGAAIWSSTLERMRRFPVQSFVRFFVNHRLFDLTGRPQWRTIHGGSRAYVERLAEELGHRLRLGAPVVSISRRIGGAFVRAAGQPEERFDQVVLATHADQALSLLGAEAGDEERHVLGAFRYQPNLAVLHSDPELMPRRRRVWASWNYLTERDTADRARNTVCVSYWMNRLQNLRVRQPIIATLNPVRQPDPAKVHESTVFHHPQFDAGTLEAQGQLPQIQGRGGVWFCGSYCGHGFHEDGLQAGLSVAAALGAPAPWAHQVVPASPLAQAVSMPTHAMAAE